MSDVFALIFVVFLIFIICSMCGLCCKKSEPGAVYSTPVVITSATHQPPGSGTTYPIHLSQTIITSGAPNQQMQMPMHNQQPMGMPMPVQQGYSPYGGAAPYPPVASPYPTTTAPYPANNATPYAAPYPASPAATAPYPTMDPSLQNPPSYNEVMTPGQTNVNSYQKQSPYNPGYPG